MRWLLSCLVRGWLFVIVIGVWALWSLAMWRATEFLHGAVLVAARTIGMMAGVTVAAAFVKLIFED